MTVIICGPPHGIHERAKSPHCEGKRAVYTWDGAYYGHTGYCECGDSWSDGELHPRPFKRGWRQEAQRRFDKKWATAIPSHLYKRYIRADLALAMSHSEEEEAAANAEMERVDEAIVEARLDVEAHIVPMLWRARSENA